MALYIEVMAIVNYIITMYTPGGKKKFPVNIFSPHEHSRYLRHQYDIHTNKIIKRPIDGKKK